MRDTLVSAYARYREQTWVVVYALATLLPAYVVAGMMATAWTGGGISRQFVKAITPGALGTTALGATLLGAYLAFVLLLFFDAKKRVQSVILGGATLLGLLVIAARGLLIPNLTAVDVVWGGVGFAAAFFAAGGRKLRDLRANDALAAGGDGRVLTSAGTDPLEFDRAEIGLFVLVSVLTVVAFFEAHVDYAAVLTANDGGLTVHGGLGDLALTGDGLAIHAVATVVFLAALGKFLRYSAQRRFFVLGPKRSGKTHFMVGTFHQAVEDGRHPRQYSDALASLHRELCEGDWVRPTRDPVDLGFTFVQGRLLPKDIDLEFVDYPGEYLDNIADGIEYDDDVITKRQFGDALTADVGGDEPVSDGGTAAETSAAPSDGGGGLMGSATIRRLQTIRDEIVPGVRRADTLVLLLDVERVLDGEDTGVGEYGRVLSRLDDKDVVVVATKADALVPEFKERYGTPFGKYDQFRRFVAQRLRKEAEVRSLLENVRTTPRPVFYATNPDGSPDFGPGDAETGPRLFGYRELLDRLGR